MKIKITGGVNPSFTADGYTTREPVGGTRDSVKYLKDEFPYKKKFYAGYDETLAATTDALKDLGWQIAETAHPSVF